MVDSEVEDDNSSRQLSPILKYSSKIPKKSTKPPDFKLSFSNDLLPGRSNILFEKPINYKPTIPNKFYTRVPKEEINHENIEKNIKWLLVQGPREKYKKPITENQKYGWYHHKLVPNPVIYYGKNTSLMVQFRIIEIDQDEKLNIRSTKKKT